MSDKEQKEYDLDKSPFSWDKLDGLLAYKSSLLVCSDILDVHENTIKNHIKARYGLTFTEYAEKRLSRTKVKLVQKAIEMANSGNVAMMIFCLKNINKWADRTESTIDVTKKSVEELVIEAKKKKIENKPIEEAKYKEVTKEKTNGTKRTKRVSKK